MLLVYVFLFFIGLCVGSFTNVLVARLDRKKGILFGRSECPNCHTRLSWTDLIPVFSYILLKGKCRYCQSHISLVYPVVELVTAITIVSYFLANGFNVDLVTGYYIALLVLLISLIFFDFLYLILPDKIIFSLAGLAFFYDIFLRWSDLTNLLVSGLLFALVFGIIYLGTQGRSIGFGDVKLALVIGLILGYPLGFFAIISAIWLAALFGIALMVFKRATLKTALPFGSFLSSATIIFIIFNEIIQKNIGIYEYFF